MTLNSKDGWGTSLSHGGGGGGGGEGGGGGGGLSTRPKKPPRLTLALSADGVTLLMTLLYFDFIPQNPDLIRIYYVSAKKLLPGDLDDPSVNLPLDQLTNIKEFVTSTVMGQETMVLSVPSYHYLAAGGWMFAVYVDSNGQEQVGYRVAFVPIPGFNLNNTAPTEVVTGVTFSKTLVGSVYRITLGWTLPNPIVTLKYLHVYVSNYWNDGLIREITYFPVGGAPLQTEARTFALESDAAAGAHNVTFYVVSTAAAHNYLNPVNTYPNVVVVGGI